MLTTMEQLGRELPEDFFFCTKEDTGTRGLPKQYLKCKNIAEVTQTLKNNQLVTKPLKHRPSL